jgi:hypothetical protein
LNPIMQGVVRSATVALILMNLSLATSITDAAEPPMRSRLFEPWINGVSAVEPQMHKPAREQQPFAPPPPR